MGRTLRVGPLGYTFVDVADMGHAGLRTGGCSAQWNKDYRRSINSRDLFQRV